MATFNRLSIQSKLILILLIVSISSICVVGYLGYQHGQTALTHTVFNHLTNLRETKARQMTSYVHGVRQNIAVLAQGSGMAEALLQFRDAFRQLQAQAPPPVWTQLLEASYRQTFLTRLARNIEGAPALETYWPTTPAALYLQYHYLAASTHSVEEGRLLIQPDDGSSYSAAHARFHPYLQRVSQTLGFYNLFLIDAETGDIVYSVSKETDFATNLTTGPYRASNLADVARAAIKGGAPGVIQVTPSIYDRLLDLYNFAASDDIDLPGKEPLPA